METVKMCVLPVLGAVRLQLLPPAIFRLRNDYSMPEAFVSLVPCSHMFSSLGESNWSWNHKYHKTKIDSKPLNPKQSSLIPCRLHVILRNMHGRGREFPGVGDQGPRSGLNVCSLYPKSKTLNPTSETSRRIWHLAGRLGFWALEFRVHQRVLVGTVL